uniref:HCO3_cotransp domain-containing protein n=1 Tax=Soboliphyme baturini TaxID=241478 RepID=A0A183I944_9BILA
LPTLQIFSEVCYKARDNHQICFAIDEFLSQSVVIPAGKMGLDNRLDPTDVKPSASQAVHRRRGRIVEISEAAEHRVDRRLTRTGKFFGGLREDLKEKASWYCSDFADAFQGGIIQTLAAALFLFFANIAKIITFGGVMDHVLHKQMGAIENVLAGGICGVIYALFSGQPMCVLSATGPCLVFEVILNDFCR